VRFKGNLEIEHRKEKRVDESLIKTSLKNLAAIIIFFIKLR
jgi:hypothetical protein